MTGAPGPTTRNPLVLRGAGLSDKGRVRDHNEDAFLMREDIDLWAVADGMGGHERGDFASSAVVGGLERATAKGTPKDQLREVLERVNAANALLRQEARANGTGAIGSTLVAFIAMGLRGLFVWVGDSRGYLLRDGQLKRATRDHSVVQELVDSGRLAPEEAEEHPHAHILTRAVGAADGLEFEFAQIDLRRGDRILLCSDGLTREVPERDIAATLGWAGDPDATCEALISAALAAGAKDNVTAVVIEIV